MIGLLRLASAVNVASTRYKVELAARAEEYQLTKNLMKLRCIFRCAIILGKVMRKVRLMRVSPYKWPQNFNAELDTVIT